MDDKPTHSRRLVLTVTPDTFAALQERAQREMRPVKSEAVRLILAGLRRERQK